MADDLKESVSIFKIDGASGRWEYLFITWGITLILYFLAGLLILSPLFLSSLKIPQISYIIISFVAIFLILLSLYFNIVVTIKRFIDLLGSKRAGIKWSVLFLIFLVISNFIPVVKNYFSILCNIFLLLKRGKVVEPKPLKITTRKFLEASLILLPLVIMVLFGKIIGEIRYAVNSNMSPTIIKNDRFWVNKFAKKAPKRGEIILFKLADNKTYFRRVIGLPGEKIEIKKDLNNETRVYINDKLLSENYINKDSAYFPCEKLKYCGSFIIPKNQYFVMSDNREVPQDSRKIGTIDKHNFIGTASYLILPFKRMKKL